MSSKPEKSQGNERNSSPSRLKSLARCINSRIRCTLSTGTSVEGILHLFDFQSQSLVLFSSTSPDSDVRIIKINHLTDFTNLDKPIPKLTKKDTNTSLPSSRRGSRPETPVKVNKEKTSDEARMLCEQLSRHFKARTNGNTIVINDTIKLGPPYSADSLVAPGDEPGLARIKNMIEQERPVVMDRLAIGKKKRDEKLPVKGG